MTWCKLILWRGIKHAMDWFNKLADEILDAEEECDAPLWRFQKVRQLDSIERFSMPNCRQSKMTMVIWIMEAKLIYRRLAVCLISLLRWRVRVSHCYNGRTLSPNASWTMNNLLCWDQTRSVHQHPLSWAQWKASPTRDPREDGRQDLRNIPGVTRLGGAVKRWIDDAAPLVGRRFLGNAYRVTENRLQDQLAQHALTNLDNTWKHHRIAIERVKSSYCHNLRNRTETEDVADVTCFCKCNSLVD